MFNQFGCCLFLSFIVFNCSVSAFNKFLRILHLKVFWIKGSFHSGWNNFRVNNIVKMVIWDSKFNFCGEMNALSFEGKFFSFLGKTLIFFKFKWTYAVDLLHHLFSTKVWNQTAYSFRISSPFLMLNVFQLAQNTKFFWNLMFKILDKEFQFFCAYPLILYTSFIS